MLVRRLLGLLCLLAACALPAPALADHPVEEGTLGAVHKDGFGQGPTSFDYTLDQGGRTLDLLPTRLGTAEHGDRVTVAGAEDDGTVAGEVTSRSLEAAPPHGAHTLAVVLVNFTGDQRQPWTPEQVRQSIFTGAQSMNAWFKEDTYDKLWFTGDQRSDGDVFGWYTVDAPSTGCNQNYGTWASKAAQQAQAAGVGLSAYDHVMYVWPSSDCGWAGMAQVGGRLSWINGTMSTRVTAHEMGHNLGLHHAGGYRCSSGGSAATLGDSCQLDEYNDPFDVMGSAARRNHGWHLQRLGVLAPGNVKTITESGTYTMRAALNPTTEPTTLRIPRRRSSTGRVLDYYYLETRKSGGIFDNFLSSDFAVNGVTIRLNDDPSVTTQSRLLDSRPASATFSDAPFSPGMSFSDGEISVGVTAAADGQATVAVTLPGAAPDTQAPTVPAGLGATPTSSGANLTWSASTDDRGVSGYVVYRDGVQIGSAPGTAYADSTAAPGAHAYAVAAQDAAGNRSGLSAPLVVQVPQPPPPPSPPTTDTGDGSTGGPGPPRGEKPPRSDRKPPRVRVKRKRRRRGRLAISVRAADAGGVTAVELFIDGRRRKATRGSSLSYTWRGRRGRHRAVARATDSSGNRSTTPFRLSR